MDSLREIAEKTNLHFSYISRLRTGKRLPSRNVMAIIGEAYGLAETEMREWERQIKLGGREASQRWMAANLPGWGE